MNATSPSISPRLALILFLAVLALALPQAALLPLLDRDEPRFAEASREMLQSGNFIVPTFNHAPRYAKPPLIYWCQAAAFEIFGENAFAARLPSLLATAATAVILLTWGTRLGNEKIGLAAGLLYAFCFQVVQQGRVATADALLIFFMTLTAFTGWLILRPKVPGCVRPACFIILALAITGGFLAKGPEALLPFLPLIWCARKSGVGIISGLTISLLVGLGLVLLWAIPAQIQSHGEYANQGLSEGIWQRIFSGLQGHGAATILGYFAGVFLYYTLLFWLSALPWSPLLILQRKKLFTAWQPDLTDTYLLLNAVLIFLVFSLMATKLPHYTLPAFPFLLLAFTRRWSAVGLPEKSLTKLGWETGLAFALATAILIPIALAVQAGPSPVGKLVSAAGDNLAPDTEFATVDFDEPNTIWEMRRVTSGYGQSIAADQVFTFLNEGGPRAVILSSELWQQLSLESTQDHPERKEFKARGFNAAKLSLLDLTLVVKP